MNSYKDDLSYHQLPLFLTHDAVRVIQWAKRIPEQLEPGRRVPTRPMTFSHADIHGFLDPTHDGPVPMAHPLRARQEAVLAELRRANMVTDAGYFRERLRPEMIGVVPTDAPVVAL